MKPLVMVGLFLVAGCAQPPLAVSPQTACQLPLAMALYTQHYYCGGR
jgi:hypothetical protein